MEAQALFVYGTLRPDDNSEAVWTKKFLEGVKGQRAVLREAQLFFDAYPCAVLGVPGHSIIGYVLTCDNEREFAAKMKEADDIEEYPECYLKDVVSVELMEDKSLEGAAVKDKGRRMCRAYVYHQKTCRRDLPIEGGDWMKRDPSKVAITEEDLK